MNKQRRVFLKQVSLSAIAVVLSKYVSAKGMMSCNILLRSGWQVENIGDIAHTPGMLHLIETFIPSAKVTFWPHYHYLPPEEVQMLKRRFPSLNIVEGTLDSNGKASNAALDEVINNADFLLHNSGPATISWAEAIAFKKRTGKPYGVYGVSFGLYGMPEKAMLSDAAFVYFRDSVSLALAKVEGVHAKLMGFTPDAAFAFDITDDVEAKAFLKKKKLQPKKYLCCIPRHRNTPVWLHTLKKRPFDEQKNARNEAMMEHDMAPLRAAITAVVEQTDKKVLIVAEDFTQIELGKKEIFDKLLKHVKKRVVHRADFWMPDEALSIYKSSAGLFGHEMHSPIICIGNGIPAIVCRWAEQSSKGVMWKDIGLGDWLFDFDKEDEVKRLVPTVLAMAKETDAFTKRATEAQELVKGLQKSTMGVVAKACNTF